MTEPNDPDAPVLSRLTVDLPLEEQHQLGDWCNRAAAELGRSAVSKADVVRSLLRILHEDSELAGRVKQELARPRQSPRPRSR